MANETALTGYNRQMQMNSRLHAGRLQPDSLTSKTQVPAATSSDPAIRTGNTRSTLTPANRYQHATPALDDRSRSRRGTPRPATVVTDMRNIKSAKRTKGKVRGHTVLRLQVSGRILKGYTKLTYEQSEDVIDNYLKDLSETNSANDLHRPEQSSNGANDPRRPEQSSSAH